jgi:hypothetical protein
MKDGRLTVLHSRPNAVINLLMPETIAASGLLLRAFFPLFAPGFSGPSKTKGEEMES